MKNYDEKMLELLSKIYPTVKDVSSEIINLTTIMNLPKGTEHFLSDLHGEYEAFLHLRNSASGIIREKLKVLYDGVLTPEEITTLATVIYYPKEKLEELDEAGVTSPEWYKKTINCFIELCRLLASKYTRSKTRKHFPPSYAYILEELMYDKRAAFDHEEYYNCIVNSIVEIGREKDFIRDLASAIKRLAVDRLHILGDIFDRGSRPDIIMDSLMAEKNVDIQWGNHDILWMGAAGGSEACIAAVLNNSITYKNLDVIEIGYGISLRPLALFANAVYGKSDVSAFMPKESGDESREKDNYLIARMHKAIAVILFKTEGEIIKRNPQFNMDDRILVDKINYKDGTICICGKTYTLRDTDFPTIDKENPLALTEEEKEVIGYLKTAFTKSEKLKRHVEFLFEKGDLYTIYNHNLLIHGCIPLNVDGSFMWFNVDGDMVYGKQMLDKIKDVVRKGYHSKSGTKEKRVGLDTMWFLWCGKNSPLCGREQITTFERLLISDESAWSEPKNAYYKYLDTEKVIDCILKEFGLFAESDIGIHSHIINGHIPIKTKEGESPIKCGGKLIIIDGGFCKAYHKKTGIAGYTLIYSANKLRIYAHEPFVGKKMAIKEGSDIISEVTVFERPTEPIRVSETDNGIEIAETIKDLKLLLKAYESGKIKENANFKK